jgi:hypothetical protein
VKIYVLWEGGLPFVDTCPQKQETLKGLGKGNDSVRFLGIKAMEMALSDTTALFVNPYGSAFPKPLWNAFYSFVNRGGCWLNLGGSPLSRPVRQNRDGSWTVETYQTGYMKQLLINQSFPIMSPNEIHHEWKEGWHENSTPDYSRCWSLQVRFTDMKDFAHEHGSSGSRDATLETLLFAKYDTRPIAAPIIAIDRLRGRFAGGRWLFVNADLHSALTPALLQQLAQHAALGACELDARPTFACFYEGEQPSLLVRLKGSHSTGQGSLTLQLKDANGSLLQTRREVVSLSTHPTHYRPAFSRTKFAPGFYHVYVTVQWGRQKHTIKRETGFWVYDEALITSGKPFSVNRDYFVRDGKPYPIMGTTYMSGDTHRKFLFEPNPAIWERDMSAMKKAGVNWIRTGIWTSWKRVMLDPGSVEEGVLRAFTAFLLTAKKHDIPVTFNFFAFWPEEWGGENPYLDPRSIQAQQELIAAFTQRFAHVPDISWDFINEPSATSPKRVWSMRPNYDAHEQKAWQQWLTEQEANFSPLEKRANSPEEVWRERWRLTENDPLSLPALTDFLDEHIHQGMHPLRALTYRLFAQKVFADWTIKMAETVRANGNPDQLITVGQDEGGIWDRPNTHFYADSVDFTANHTWWQNDDLLWDSIITKPPHKPNVSQETGIMFYEKVDGTHWRTPEDAARLLARKLALSFAGGCAGAIQWLWNTNIYMDSDNEVGIGFHRADGTEKPELNEFRKIAAFVNTHAERFQDRELEEVCLIIPHSNTFTTRGFGDQASRVAVRVLESDLGVPVRAVSEYFIEHLGSPRLIVLPAPNSLNESCWEAILTAVKAGSTLVATGTLDRDEYFRPISRIADLSKTDSIFEPVLHFESFRIASESWQTQFSGQKLQRIEKQSQDGNIGLHTIQYGAGTILYTGLPLEIGEKNSATTSLYAHACTLAGVAMRPQALSGVTVRRVVFKNAILFLLLSETSQTEQVTITFEKADFTLEVPAGNAVMVFTDRHTGAIVGVS